MGKRNYFMLLVRGAAMGAADVIPGVSGGTIAFITGIYTELIESIRSFDTQFIKLLFTGKFRHAWAKINGSFLFSVLAGIALSIFSLARLMKYLLETHPVLVWSFFFGLIIASAALVARQVKKWSAAPILAGVAGTALAYWITVVSPASTPDVWWFVVLSGAVAICAMILPGISGAFILLLMGKYAYIIHAVSTFNLSVLLLFASGALVGIVSFSHLLSWLLKKHHSTTIALLIGFMVGSLNKIWPWKEATSTFVDEHGAVQVLTERNVSPAAFEQLTGSSAQLWEAIGFALFGFLLIWGIQKMADLLEKRRNG